MKQTILSLTLLISAPALWAFSPAELAQTLQKPQKRTRQFCPTTPAQIPQQTHDHQRQLYPCPTKRPALENAKTI